MVVLENNYKKIECSNCHSLLGIEDSDWVEGYMGIKTCNCPVCGEEIEKDEEFVITPENIKYPTHFFHFGGDENAAEPINEEKIRKFLRTAIDCIRKEKDNYGMYYLGGRSFAFCKRYPGDEEYFVAIAPDYYSVGIPFIKEDYWEGWDDFEE